MDGLYQVGDRQLTYASCGVRGLGISVSYVTYIYESTSPTSFMKEKLWHALIKSVEGKRHSNYTSTKNETRMG
jgi:hypothetical protein